MTGLDSPFGASALKARHSVGLSRHKVVVPQKYPAGILRCCSTGLMFSRRSLMKKKIIHDFRDFIFL
jgi:hypothetical protein